MKMRVLLPLALALGMGLGGCLGSKFSGESELKKLDQVSQAAVTRFDPATLTFHTEYCSSDPIEVNYDTAMTFVVDQSGSNYDYPGDPGTDNLGERRFQSLIDYLENLKATHSAEELTRFRFSLIVFNDSYNANTFDPSSVSARATGLGYMDRVYDQHRDKTRSSFVEIDEFLALVRGVYQKVSTTPLGTGWRNNTKAATDYQLALQELNRMLARELDLLELQSLEEGSQFRKPFFVLAFISDGAPAFEPKQKPGELTFHQYIKPEMQKVEEAINSTYKEITLGYSFHTVAYSTSRAALDAKAPAECFSGNPSELVLHKCPRQLLKRMADMAGGDAFEVYQSEKIPYDKFSIPSFNLISTPVNFFFTNRSLVWSDDGKLTPAPLNNGLTREQLQDLCERRGLSLRASDGLCDLPPYTPLSLLGEYLLKSDAAARLAQSQCASIPGAALDEDGDGLKRCEELALGSDPNRPFSTGDMIPDGLAARVGLPFRTTEASAAQADSDQDGLSNLNELLRNTPVFIPNTQVVGLTPQTLSVQSLGIRSGRACYRVQVAPVMFQKATEQLELWVVESTNVNSPSGVSKVKRVVSCVGDYTGGYAKGEKCDLTQSP